MSQYLIDINQTNLTNVNQIKMDNDSIQTMSSVEIAELCGKQHKNVMRDIKQIFTELKFEPSEFAGVYKDSTGRTLPCYNLPKRECLILVSGYSTALRAKIIDRWQELEKQVSTPQLNLASALQNPLTIRQLLLESINQLENLKSEVNTLKPKAIALEGLKRSDGLFGIIDAAKILEIRPKDLSNYLCEHDWVYRRAPGAPLLPYQDKIKKGLMDCPVITIQRPDGTEKTIPSTKITTKGLAYLREEIYGNMQ